MRKLKKLELRKDRYGRPVLAFSLALANEVTEISFEQPLTNKDEIEITNEFLRRLNSGLEVKFINYKQYRDLINNIHKAVVSF